MFYARRCAPHNLPSQARPLGALSLLCALVIGSSGCASGVAMQEDTSLELALIRAKVVEKNDTWAERLMTQTKVGDEDWPGELYTINEQHISLRNQIRRGARRH